jgi:site-specific DNA-methyltransferase (adenine-specific)
MDYKWPNDYLIPGIEPFHQEEAGIIYNADCRDTLPHLPKVDLVLTDPPYGITENSKRRLHAYRNPIKSGGRIGGPGFANVTEYGNTHWNHCPLDSQLWQYIKNISHNQIIWGANHLLTVLGKPPTFLVWDKKCQNGWKDSFSDCELAYLSTVGPDRLFRHQWMGAIRAGKKIKRQHPTQKPIELMNWCLGFFPEANIILDPFLGSGTTAVAAKELGRKFIGIEISEEYCSIAVKRLRQGVLNFE